jgi:hypothetical protein
MLVSLEQLPWRAVSAVSFAAGSWFSVVWLGVTPAHAGAMAMGYALAALTLK